jgi:hypothetical protein
MMNIVEPIRMFNASPNSEHDSRDDFRIVSATLPTLEELYSNGASLARISSLTNLPRERVRLMLHSAGVQMRHVLAIYHPAAMELNHDSAMLLGLHAGDGYLSDVWGISVCNKDKSMGERVVMLTRDILGVEPGFDHKKDGNFIIRSAKPQVFEFFEYFGFRRGRKATTVSVPPLVASSSDIEVIVGFLKGAFSSDGCFSYRRNWGQCRFVVSSKSFRDGFVELGRKLGFKFHCYSYPHHTGHNKLPLNTAYIGSRSEVIRWMETVGSISDTHLQRYRMWRSKRF